MTGQKHTNDNKNSVVAPWIRLCDGLRVYKFIVFHDDSNISRKKLESILRAQSKDCNCVFGRDYQVRVDIKKKIYDKSEMTNKRLLNGRRIPVLITDDSVESSFPSYHWVKPYGTRFPSLPDGTPYIVVQNIAAYYTLPENPYGASPTTIPHDTYAQVVSMLLSHELHETIGNDSTSNCIQFDMTVPAVQNWHYGEFDEYGTCINGTIGSDGYVHLPLFSDVFPNENTICTVMTEQGDVVSRGLSFKFDSYKVDGWRMQNYPTYNFWQPNLPSSNKLQFDHLNHLSGPLNPLAGLHESAMFTNVRTNTTIYADVSNYGPVTAEMRGQTPLNNFPPNYTIVMFTIASSSSSSTDTTTNTVRESKTTLNKRHLLHIVPK